MATAAPAKRRLFGSSKRMRWCLWSVLVFAFCTRAASLIVWSENLQTDPDAYRGIAANMLAGEGFSIPETKRPTAYRPPLYPMFVAMLGNSPVAIGIAQLLVSLCTVWLTFRIGTELVSETVGLWAAAWVTVDPLLLQSVSLPMTETLFTTLLAALLWMILRGVRQTASTREQFASGFLFGLCALCRPTIWAWGGLVLAWGLWRRLHLRLCARHEVTVQLDLPWVAWLGVFLTVSPWVVRNQIVLGQPIVMTTHGGYTLLLGNNPVFYREVVNFPFGTTWTGPSLANWKTELEAELAQQQIPRSDEVARNDAMSELARQEIRKQPRQFLKACVLRLRRFWNLSPQGEAALSFPLNKMVAGFYLTLFLTAGIGAVILLRTQLAEALPLFLLPVSFTCVHLVYWSNMRMRTPLLPVLAICSSVAIVAVWERWTTRKHKP